MTVTAVVGFQAGDEGKGKVVDMLAEDSDWVVRFQGGANAGHTIVVKGEKYVSHLLPSGALYPKVKLGIGRGIVLDIFQLKNEVMEFEKRAEIDVTGRLFIDEKAQLLLPYHRILDLAQEKSNNRGTTARGIGPAYEDEAGRRALYAYILSDRKRLAEQVKRNCELAEKRIKHVYGIDGKEFEKLFEIITEKENRGSQKLLEMGLLNKRDLDYSIFLRNSSFDHEAIAEQAYRAGVAFQNCLVDLPVMLNTSLNDEKILLEGAQGRELDKRHGMQPGVTSSHTSSAEALLGTGLGPGCLDAVIGIGKAYATKVGTHIFPTQMEDTELSRKLKKFEFGATTGRQRMVGWSDLPQARLSQLVNRHNQIGIMKIDLMTGQDIKICVAYELDGQKLEFPPNDPEELKRCVPVYKEFAAWEEEVDGVRRFDDLPREAQEYLRFIEKEMGKVSAVKLKYVGVGPDREQIIVL